MNTTSFIELILQELSYAKTKHPEFVKTMTVWNAERISWRLKGMREHLNLPDTTCEKDFEDILHCEVLEFLEAYTHGDYCHAIQELAQCAAVCVRAMEKCEERLQEKGE